MENRICYVDLIPVPLPTKELVIFEGRNKNMARVNSNSRSQPNNECFVSESHSPNLPYYHSNSHGS